MRKVNKIKAPRKTIKDSMSSIRADYSTKYKECSRGREYLEEQVVFEDPLHRFEQVGLQR